MSYETWKQKYYPTDAITFRGGDLADLDTVIEAIEHSLRKWRGLSKTALREHGLVKSMWRIGKESQDREEYDLSISGNSCALCMLSGQDCDKCPIVEVTGDVCDGDDSQYDTWCSFTNPDPMIDLLETVLQHYLDIRERTAV